MRWNKRYDGTRESLLPRLHRPHSPHLDALTETELDPGSNRHDPNISVCELYGKLLQEKAYSLHPGSLYRMFVRLGYRKKVESTKKRSKHLGHYETPTEFGEKWQLDVKYVPQACYVGKDDERFFQYTMPEEASRKRFIYDLQGTERLFRGGLCEAGHSLLWLFAPNHSNRQWKRVLQ